MTVQSRENRPGRKSMSLMQELEDRRLFSSTGTTSAPKAKSPPTQSNTVTVSRYCGTLYVSGAVDKTNSIVLTTVAAEKFEVKVNGKKYGTYAASSFSQIQIWGGNQNDKIIFNESKSRGGFGGTELDVDVQIKCHSGSDRVDLDLTPATAHGDSGDDTLLGSRGDDNLYGDSGNDRVYGGDGNDLVNGGKGNDDVRGDAGDDSVYGERGDDYLDGGKGSDWLNGGEGYNHLVDYSSGDERNRFVCGDGKNYIYCSADDDLVDVSPGYDQVYFD